MILTLSYRFLSGVKWQFSQKKVLCAQFQGKTLFSHDISNKLLQFNWPNNQTKDRLLFNWNTQFKIYLLENFLVIDRTIMFKFVVESVPKEGGVYVGTKIKKLFRQIEFHIFFPLYTSRRNKNLWYTYFNFTNFLLWQNSSILIFFPYRL